MRGGTGRGSPHSFSASPKHSLRWDVEVSHVVHGRAVARHKATEGWNEKSRFLPKTLLSLQVSLVVHIPSIQSVSLQSPQWARLLLSLQKAAGHSAAIAALVSAERYLQDLLDAGLIGSFQANRMTEDLHQAYSLRCRAIDACTASKGVNPAQTATYSRLGLRTEKASGTSQRGMRPRTVTGGDPWLTPRGENRRY